VRSPKQEATTTKQAIKQDNNPPPSAHVCPGVIHGSNGTPPPPASMASLSPLTNAAIAAKEFIKSYIPGSLANPSE
jgi:hypothetical protein